MENWKELIAKLNSHREKKEISHQQIADKTGLHRSNITRFFAAKYCPKMEMFDLISEVIGYKLDLKVCKKFANSKRKS